MRAEQQRFTVQVAKLFQHHHINAALPSASGAVKPEHGSHIKGCHSAVLFQVIPSYLLFQCLAVPVCLRVSPPAHRVPFAPQVFPTVAAAVGWGAEYTQCIGEVRRVFALLYQFSPAARQLEGEVLWMKANVGRVMSDFQRLFGRDKLGNYVHQLKHHACDLLDRGGLWAYATDTQETMQALMKTAFHLWTPRFGGTAGHVDTLRKVFERRYMKLYVFLLPCGPVEPQGVVRELRRRRKLLLLLEHK